MAGKTDNEIVIDAPLDLVWEVTNDVAAWSELFSEYAATEILSEESGTIRFRLTTVPDELDRTWSWVSERTPDPATHTVRAKRVETGPFEYMNLFWDYSKTPMGVRMRWRQDFAMKPGAPFDDAAMTERLNTRTRKEMARIKELLERRAESENPGAKPR